MLDKIYYNCINLPRKSVFYAAYGNLVAALETNPQKGNLYTHSTWQQKEGTVITYLPIFHKESIVRSTSEFIDDWNDYQAFLEKMDKNAAIVVEEIYDFIATVFTAPVNPNNKVEYIFSAIIFDIFMNDPDYNVDCSSDEVGKKWLSHRTATAIAPNHKEELIKWENQEISDERISLLMEQYNVLLS